MLELFKTFLLWGHVTLTLGQNDCWCSTASLNIRDAPCGNIIGGVNPGDCLEKLSGSEDCVLDGVTQTFLQLNYNGDGWASSDYLVEGDCAPPGNVDPGVCSEIRWLTRAEWGARPPTSVTPLSTPVSTVFVHHTYTAHCYTEADCIAQVQSVQDFHMDGNGWNDIGYNFLIGEDGQAYEGRGWDVQGAHTGGSCNPVSVAVSLIGNFDAQEPNQAIMDALRNIIDCGIEEGHILPWASLNMLGHRDVCSTDCPGLYVYSDITTWPWYGQNPGICNC